MNDMPPYEEFTRTSGLVRRKHPMEHKVSETKSEETSRNSITSEERSAQHVKMYTR